MRIVQLKKEATAVDKADPNAVSIAKGVEYLKTQAPRWKNEGYAMRALLVAGGKGYDVGTALDPSLAILKQPASWDKDAHIELTSALAAAERYGRAASTDLEAAAKLLTADQQTDGSWGSILGTWSARTSLIASGMQPDNFTIVQADRWIRGIVPETVNDASATILALELASDVMAENLRRNCLSILRQAQASTGGWGADPAAPEVFDTALAVLALNALQAEPRLARFAYRPEELKETVAKGKAFLVSQQRPDGSWPETATGWALLALLSGS